MAFIQAYVQEVLPDPSMYEGILTAKAVQDDPSAEKPPENMLLSKAITNVELLTAPYNSAIIKLSDGDDTKEILAHPMLSGHLCMPLKAGEQVWVTKVGEQYYWLTRINFEQTVDDVNLSLAGRYKSTAQTYDGEGTAGATDKAEGNSGNVLPTNQNQKLNIQFPAEDTVELNPDKKLIFEKYFTDRKRHAPEPVPRYKKRPGDLVLQGSSNTLICLGSSGGHKKEDVLTVDTKSLALFPQPDNKLNLPGKGAIDLVAGRGRYLPSEPTSADALGNIPIRTACYTVQSTFGKNAPTQGWVETDKNVAVNDKSTKFNQVEGDADFFIDASRIYLTIDSEVDVDFSLDKKTYPKIPKVLGVNEAEVDPAATKGAGIVIKSDNVRIVSRYHKFADVDTEGNAIGTDVNGNIRIVKEGLRDDSGHSATDGTGASLIALESDGTVMIDGATIVIGTGREKGNNGEGDHIYLGTGATEPMVLGTQLHTLLKNYFTAMETFLSAKFDTHIHPTGAGPSSPPTVTGDDGGTGTAKSELDNILSKIGKLK